MANSELGTTKKMASNNKWQRTHIRKWNEKIRIHNGTRKQHNNHMTSQ